MVPTRIPWATKHRMEPNHNNNEKPLNICLQNLTHSGVVGGGVRTLGPSRSKTSLAFALVKPCVKVHNHLLHPDLHNNNNDGNDGNSE